MSILPNLGGRELGLVADARHEGPGILDEHVVVSLHASGWAVAACGRVQRGELRGLLDAMDQGVRKVVSEDRDGLCEGSDELLMNHSLILNYRHCDEVGARALAILIHAFKKLGLMLTAPSMFGRGSTITGAKLEGRRIEDRVGGDLTTAAGLTSTKGEWPIVSFQAWVQSLSPGLP